MEIRKVGGSMMSAVDVDLDQPTAPKRPVRTRRALVLAAALVVLAATVTVASIVAASPPRLPVVVISAQWLPGSERLPTAVVWYRDGGREDVTGRLHRRWQPDRPVRLVTVVAEVAEVACRIDVDGRTVATDRSTRYRYAICTWIAA